MRSPVLFLGVLLSSLSTLTSCVESTSYTPVPPSIPAARLPMNDAYLGSVHAGPLRPLFRWEPATAQASGTISYQLQLSTDWTFESNVTSIETTETTYQPDSDLPVSLTPPVGTRYFWRLRSCLGNSCSEYSRPRYFNLGRVIKDYNGDGYSDIAVGAPGNDSYLANAGRGFVYFGGPGRTMDETADLALGGAAELRAGEQSGRTIQSAGDVNGDGFADLIWPIPGNIPMGFLSGYAYLYYGGAGASFDGKADSLLSSVAERDGFAFSAGALGDINGDGFGDIFVVSAPGGTSGSQVDVFMGNASLGLNAKSDGAASSPSPNLVVGSAGDVNGDGLGDVIVGAPSDTVGGTEAGAAYLYLGEVGDAFEPTADVTFIGRGVNERSASTVASVGDVNGDGLSDMMIANLKDEVFEQPGTVDLFLGNAGEISTVPSVTVRGSGGYDSFGVAIEGIGDANGDGFDDVVIGAISASDSKQNAGRAYLYYGGGRPTFDTTPEMIFEGSSVNDYFGIKLSGGDFNGDGLPDIASSAEFPPLFAGRVEVFLNDGGSFFLTPSSSFRGTTQDESLGLGLAMFLAPPRSNTQLQPRTALTTPGEACCRQRACACGTLALNTSFSRDALVWRYQYEVL